MKKINIFFTALLALAIMVSCGKKGTEVVDPNPTDSVPGDDDENPIEDPNLPYRFLLTARQSSANVQGPSYLLKVSQVTSGSVTLSQSGWQADQNGGTSDASIWFYPGNKAAYHFVYRQGPSDVSSYFLDANGDLQQHDDQFQIEDGSGTFGIFGNKMVTISNHYVNGKLHSKFNFFDSDTKQITTKSIPTENITGSNASSPHYFAGVVGVGDKFYSGICISGRTDSIWIAEFDENLNYKIIRDDRLSYSAGRFRSIYFGQLDADEEGNLYVFSSSFESGTSKPSGALRINAGESEFDPDYHFNIQALTGGRAVYKVWHVTGDYFLIQTYTATEKSQSNPDVKKLAIANMKEKTLKWVEGIPAEHLVSRIANSPCLHEGKILMPITTSANYPYIYTIDPETATATQGLKVIAGDVVAIGKINLTQ